MLYITLYYRSLFNTIRNITCKGQYYFFYSIFIVEIASKLEKIKKEKYWEEGKISLVDMIQRLENPRESHGKKLLQIKKCNQVLGYKINIQS